MNYLSGIDWTIMAVYFAFVLGIGFVLRRSIKSSTDFFLSGRSLPAWVTGLAFISANLGAQEVIGMGASGAKYGIATSHFYWVGAIPAMVFVGIFMMPFYYGSRARSVPEYLKLRFDEKTRGLNAISFAVMTVFSSGISMYAMGLLLETLLGWNFNVSVLISAVIVLVYIFLGGLTSAIYNEVLQFFLIVMGFLPLVFLGLKDAGGWDGLKQRLATVATDNGFASGAWTHSWEYMNKASANPMGVEWFGMVMGLGFVLSFGYWCTDFLGGAAGDGGRFDVGGTADAIDCGDSKNVLPILGDFAGNDCDRVDVSIGSEWISIAEEGGRDLCVRHGDPVDADALFSDGHVGRRAYRTDGKLHVGDGRQRDGVQYGLDLRHLSGVSVSTGKRSALFVDGADGDDLRDRDFGGGRLCSDAIQ